jgi:hypothetical protein
MAHPHRLTDEEIDCMTAHIKDLKPCPLCGNDAFIFAGKYAMMTAADNVDPIELGPGVLALMIALCSKCYFSMPFAWKPIWANWKEVSNGGTSK